MPILTNARHERFAQELAAGKTADEAYQLAGYKPDRGNACRLTTNDNVRARVAELQGRVVEGVVLTKQWIIEKLIENATRAMERNDGSVANRALELLGKEQGMFVDRKEVGKPGEFERMNADELREYIRQEASELGLGDPPATGLNGSGKPH